MVPQPGVQIWLQHWSVLAQLAFPVSKPTEFASRHYLRTSLEVKRYFKIRASDMAPYLSLEGTYAQRSFVDTNGGAYFKGPMRSRYSYSNAAIRSPIVTGAVKGGLEVELGRRFFIDVFAGAGVRSINTTYNQVRDEASDPYSWIEVFHGPRSAYRYEGQLVKLHGTIGFRLGYTLW